MNPVLLLLLTMLAVAGRGGRRPGRKVTAAKPPAKKATKKATAKKTKPPRGPSFPDPRLMSTRQMLTEFRRLRRLQKRQARRWRCTDPGCDGRPHTRWLHKHARGKQHPPTWTKQPWTVWLIMTGRGWGKTRTAAQEVYEWARDTPGTFIAVVAKNETLVREICFEHRRSGLLTVIPAEEIAYYHSSPGNVEILLKNGSRIRGFGAEVPDNLRGWEFDKAWCDEYAAWKRQTAQGTWDMLWFCLREAAEAQVICTTTPKPLPHLIKLYRRHFTQLGRIMEARQAAVDAGVDPDIEHPIEPRVRLTTGHMYENRDNLSEVAIEEYEDEYAGTRQGDQELGGELLEDVEGSLWKGYMFEDDPRSDDTPFRVARDEVPLLDRVVVALDTAVTTTETADESGIAVMGRTPWRDITERDQRPRGYLLHSEARKTTPMQTMARVAELYHEWGAQAAVFEGNQGGEYLITVMQMVDPTVNCRLVWAAKDKRARATPVAALYEQERMHHVYDRHAVDDHGRPVSPAKQFDVIETWMTTYTGSPESKEKSPDELDAVVWAATDLFLDPATLAPRPKAKGQGGGDSRLKGRR